MSLNVNQTATLLGGGASGGNANPYDLVNGTKQDVTSAVLSGVVKQADNSNLTQTQSDSFSSLEDFINQNLGGDDAKRLLTSLNALRKLTQLGNNDKAALDPVYSVLAKNQDVTKSIPSGSLVSEVA